MKNLINMIKKFFSKITKGTAGILGCFFGFHVYENDVCVYCGKHRP